MNILGWLLCLSILVTVMLQAVGLHKATVCRQEAWLKSTELKTSGLLPNAKPTETNWVMRCQIEVRRSHGFISWKKVGHRSHTYSLPLEGLL